ncbi:MAG TPA: hypothetical protein PLW44_18245 [Chitinophagales bacterium]|nr:hypothetical protein [Chitinophagales bacterium]
MSPGFCAGNNQINYRESYIFNKNFTQKIIEYLPILRIGKMLKTKSIMNHNEKYCVDLLAKVLKDLAENRGELYYDKDAPFEAYFKKKELNFYTKEVVENSWLVYAKVPKDGWKGGNIIIHIDDDTGKALTFVNTALGGRPITLPLAIKPDGSYYIPLEYR